MIRLSPLYINAVFTSHEEIIIIIINIIIIIIIIELTYSKTIVENTVEIEPQPVAIDFKDLSLYSNSSK